MCHGTFIAYSQCGHTVFAGMTVCTAEGDVKGTVCPYYTSSTSPVLGECPECVYGTPSPSISDSLLAWERSGHSILLCVWRKDLATLARCSNQRLLIHGTACCSLNLRSL
jgi:hypothetical protein